MSIHAEWLSLIEVSGAFLAEPILAQAFPQGLESLPAAKKQAFRQTYEEWRDALDFDDELQAKLHQEWINWVLKKGLEWDEDDEGGELKTGTNVPEHLKLELLEHNLTLTPDYALFSNNAANAYLLVASYPAHVELLDVIAGDGWSTSPAERMSQLCRATNTRLGLVTNGEQWMVVDAPEGGITSYASWYARLWSQESITLKAFFGLLNISTVFSGVGLGAKKLSELLDESLKHQDDVTKTLGSQVQRAVEVLIQSLDRINNDSNKELLKGVEPSELYEAGLTYMMRLVFLLCAEERGLLLLGDETYEANYAVSTLRMKLREETSLHGEEVLSRRNNAWARLLAVFRAIYGGVKHENMRMAALGGSLFDPDRFPFLEGRSKGSSWKLDEARPLPIDNRTVLLFLDAIQLYQGRTLSYRALDVEQIGYVYEGLLERTVIRAADVTLELDAGKKSKKPWVLLGELASSELEGSCSVQKLLQERTGKDARVTTSLAKETSDVESENLLLACQNDSLLRDRIKPYYHLLRMDAWGNPLLYLKGSFMIAVGSGRRETGTHYTPKPLTESIVKEALESVVYNGPAEGKRNKDWQLKTPAELLDLKICDLAMGSGAFLVQVCRYLSERLLEAWAQVECHGKALTVDGVVVDDRPGQDLLTKDAEERLVTARRLISERCLYGVDVNPLAVELAKLSIWLVTLSKGRPFGFLDHNLKHGDSLLGITDLEQLYYLDMKPTKLREGGGVSKQLFAHKIEESVKQAIALRLELRKHTILDIHDVEVMKHLNQKTREKLELPDLVADALVGETLKAVGKRTDFATLSIEVGRLFDGEAGVSESLIRSAKVDLNIDLPEGKQTRKIFHWCLEFPEIFVDETSGFDAIVGNPPYMGGTLASELLGEKYMKTLQSLDEEWHGKADFAVGFVKKAASILTENAGFSLLTTASLIRGESLDSGISALKKANWEIHSALSPFKWPGTASLEVVVLSLRRNWSGVCKLNGEEVIGITNDLKQSSKNVDDPVALNSNNLRGWLGIKLCPKNKEISKELYEAVKEENPCLAEAYWPAIGGSELYGLVDILDAPRSISPSKIAEIYEKNCDLLSSSYVEIGLPNSYKHSAPAKALNEEIKKSLMVFACGETSTILSFSLVPKNSVILKHKLVVFPASSWSVFSLLQSNIHVSWAWKWGLRRKRDLVYSPKRCAGTFPFPDLSESSNNIVEELESAGEKYYSLRENIIFDKQQGLTSVNNLVHDKYVDSDEIVRLRDVQVCIDHLVLVLFGWSDIQLDHGFYSLYEGERYGLSPHAKDEILYRLAMLNKTRHASHLNTSTRKKPKAAKPKKVAGDPQSDMFGGRCE